MGPIRKLEPLVFVPAKWMEMHVKRVVVAAVSFVMGLMLIGSASAFPPAAWNDGDELEIFGHTFEEEYWTNSSMNATTPQGNDVTFSASYVNENDFQAFLLALNMVEDENGSGTVPFQLFGMHYLTPEGREVFIGAVLAFLMVFDDTYNGTGPGSNGLPDPGHEDISYVIPFAIGGALDDTYPPEVEVQEVEKLGESHYRFGIQYRNLYAFVSPNFLLSMVYSSGWIAKFSELTVSYEITMDNETGEVRAETWYTIGQVTELWGFLLGIPIPLSVDAIPDTLGLSVVHSVTVFTSKYQGATGNSTGTTFDTGINAPLDEDIVLAVGDDSERAMKIGTRGTFDLIDEDTDDVIEDDQAAMNAIIGAGLVDLLLVAWQLGFAAGAMSIFAYALSDYVQSAYESPLDLCQRSLVPANADGFNANPLWYAVSFPEWNGYRVVHDPVYTAYTYVEAASEEEAGTEFNPAGLVMLVLIVGIAVVAIVALATRKKSA
ncbi:MAG: hypothetical protein JSV90_06470 [Methanobacteriota archaeon]|nr:MAG: hypothetical protein JSV90_06470 [Euryarchaeota archaeon]